MSAITIKGIEYPVDLSDLYVVRDLVDAAEGAQRIKDIPRSEYGAAEIRAVVAFAETARAAIARAIGQENADEAFGDRMVLSEVMSAVNQLAGEVGPAYDQMLADLTE